MSKKKEVSLDIKKAMVKEMVESETIVFNTGVLEYKGKGYILIVEVKEL